MLLKLPATFPPSKTDSFVTGYFVSSSTVFINSQLRFLPQLFMKLFCLYMFTLPARCASICAPKGISLSIFDLARARMTRYVQYSFQEMLNLKPGFSTQTFSFLPHFLWKMKAQSQREYFIADRSFIKPSWSNDRLILFISLLSQ